MPTNIALIDLVIIAVSILGMIAMGFWIGRGNRTAEDYLIGGGALPWWTVLGSIVATETSTATFLSVPGIAYAAGGNLTFLQIAAGFLIGRILVTWLLLPGYFAGHLYSAYQLLRERFGPLVQRLASLMFLVARNVGDGLRLFLAALALEKVLSIDLMACILVIGVATILYTFFGGIRAVVYSDCVQLLIYLSGGIIALVILVGMLPEGLASLIEFANQTGRLQAIDWRLSKPDGGLLSNPYSLWAGLIGGAVLTLGTHGTDQMMVQRLLCAGQPSKAGRALILSGVVVFCQFTLFLMLGIALACYYAEVEVRSFQYNDEVFATFIVDHLPVGVVGLTLAAVFSAAMSTLSSSLNSSATAAANDFFPHAADDSQVANQSMLRRTRVLTVAFGVVQIVVAMIASTLSTSVVNDALAIAGFTAGILLGTFLLGSLTRTANQGGVACGIACGIAVLLGVKLFTPIAWTWYAVIGVIVTFGVGWSASRMWPTDNNLRSVIKNQ